jgi:FixJ family two-component response regulator
MAEETPTVYIVDDDVSVQEAIAIMVESVGLRAQTFASARDFLRIAPAAGPGCLVLDVRLPGVSGLEFQAELMSFDIQIPIIFVTGFGDIPMTVRALKAGAVEFLTKPFRDQDLLDAIQQALTQDRATRELRAELGTLRERFETLSARERQVMFLVVSGRINKDIAAELGTSEITIKTHRGRIMRKMQAESLIDLAKMAAKLGDYTKV